MHDPQDNTNPYSTVSAIDSRLGEIEDEKRHLLALREELQKPEPSPPISGSFSPEQKVTIFRSLFRGRADIFAKRWHSQQGQSGYSVACDNEWVRGICNKPRIKCRDCNHRQLSELNDQVIYRHLAGQQVVGLYPLLQDNTCYLLAADFDKGSWREEVKAMSQACAEVGVPHAIEISRSGNGAHLWIFFDDRVLASEARLLGFALLDKAMEVCTNLSFDSYDRLFPNQDILPGGGFGNLIALPLQREARLAGFSLFVNAELQVIDDQWQYLAQMQRLSKHGLSELLNQISPGTDTDNDQQVADTRKPWEMTAKLKPLALENPPQKVVVTLANHVYFELKQLPGALAARLRRLASFSNPVFFKTQALRFSTHGIPRFISCARVEQGYLALPRGCLDEAVELLKEHKIDVQTDDRRELGAKLKAVKPSFTLRKNQKTAVKEMSKHDSGILHAPTAFGKTVTAIGLIAKRKRSTLILVHSRQLLDQWRERLRSFLPETVIGTIAGGGKKPSGVIDIATYQSLINKKDNTVAPIVQEYGHVIIDECHHLSAPRYEMVLNEVRAKYVLGLTATPERQDGHQKIVFMAAGPIRHKVKDASAEHFKQEVYVHQLHEVPPLHLTQSEGRPKVAEAYRWIANDKQRTRKIVEDVIECVRDAKHPIVLTERREHAESINKFLEENGIASVVMKGAMKAAERKSVDERLRSAQVVVATGKYVGEGFDLPRLDTLFLAMPIAWKGSLAQYAGRIHRESEGKVLVTIHDYVDCRLPMLQRMFSKRERSYKTMGYTIRSALGAVGSDDENKIEAVLLE